MNFLKPFLVQTGKKFEQTLRATLAKLHPTRSAPL
jgi:hypothetical protein